MAPVPWQYFLPPLIVFVAVTAVIMYLFSRKLKTGKERFMASFHLQQDSALLDFKLLAVSIFLLFNGFAVSLADIWLNSGFLTSLGRFSWLLAGVVSFTVAVRWLVKVR